MKWFWGLLLTVFGLIFLGENFNLWSMHQLDEVARFWPLILVLFGIALMVNKLKLGWLIITVSFIAALALVCLASFGKNPPSSTSSQNIFQRSSETYNFSQNLPDGVKKAKIIINTGAVELNIKETDAYLINGNLVSNYSQPSLSTTISDDTATVTLKNEKINSAIWGKNTFNIQITDKIPVELVINAGASSGNLDFAKMTLSSLDLHIGASAVDIALGKISNNGNVDIQTGASNITIKASKEMGIRINTKTGLTSTNFQGFTKIDDQTYESQNYGQAADKFNLNISAGASNVNVEQN